MYLYERLFGVFVYTFTLLSFCYLIYRSKYIYTKVLMRFYLLFISIIAFLYVPAVEADLYRLIEYMNNYASLSNEAFRSALLNSSSANTPVSMIYFRVIGSLGITGLLAGITTLIVFSNILYIISDYSKRLKSSNRVAALTLFTIMSTGFYMATVSGIRNALAFSITARCIYDEECNGKNPLKNTVWYLLACLIHPAAIAVLLIRIIALTLDKYSKRKIRSLLSTLVYIIFAALTLVYLGATVYLKEALSKFTSYAAGVGYTYFWDNIITVLIILLIFINYYLYSKIQRNSTYTQSNNLIRLSHLLSFISLLFCFEISIFMRFTQLNLIIMLPIIMSNMSHYFNLSVKTIAYINTAKIALYITLTIFLISISRGTLSSLKFFIIG